MATITMYQNDTLPALTRQLLDQNGNIINLTGATIVLRAVSGGQTTTTLAGSVTVTNAAGGNISYAWNATDTATPGSYQLWYIVTMSGGAKEHSVGPDTLIITTAP
jgi:BppU N-terminal domain